MTNFLKSLCKPLDMEVRQIIYRNAESMMRTVKYLIEQEHENWIAARMLGWSYEKIEALVGVISFYQSVIGPLKSCSTNYSSSVLDSRDIVYGTKLRINDEMSKDFYEIVSRFEHTTNALGIDFWWLQTTNADDLVYKIGHVKKNEERPDWLG